MVENTGDEQSAPITEPQTKPEPEQHPPLQVSDLVPRKKPSKKQKITYAALFILLLIILGFAAYKLGSRKPAVDNPGSNAEQQATSQSSEKDVPDVAETKDFENGFLGLKLTYPANWTAVEDDNRTELRLESPEFNYQTASTGAVDGYFRIYIRRGARDVDGQYIGSGYAIQQSQKLVYSNPAEGQRADTLLTLFGIDTPDNFGFFMIAGNYNLNQGDTLGPDYGKEAETYIIAGGFSSKTLEDDMATNPVSPELVQTSNAYKQAIKILESIQVR